MTTTTIERPATEKAVQYLRSLWAEREVDASPEAAVARFDANYASHGLSAARCSKAIDQVKALPKRKVEPKSLDEQAQPGYYVDSSNGDLLVVVLNRAKTFTYAKRLVVTTGPTGKKTASWEHAPGAAKSLTDITPMTLAEAAAFGHAHGICAICCKTLTVPASVARGIGPRCAKRFGVKAPAKVEVVVEPEPKPYEPQHFCEDFDGECCQPGGAMYESYQKAVKNKCSFPNPCTPMMQCSKHSQEYQRTYGRAANE